MARADSADRALEVYLVASGTTFRATPRPVTREALLSRAAPEGTVLGDRLSAPRVTRLARRLLARCAELNHQINPLEAELRKLVNELAPSLLAIPRCRVLSARRPHARTGSVTRMDSPGPQAPSLSRCGRAPGKGRVRLNRGGNRAMNCALHMIAVTHARGVEPR